MFLLFGRKTKYRPLNSGGYVKRECPECGETATIVECERVHTYQAYFVGLFDTKKTVWVCRNCQEEVDVAGSLPSGDEDERRAELEAAERARLEQARAARRQQIAEKAESVKQKVEDELAALKAKLARK